MIRLQLLPDYVFEGEKIVRAVIVCTVILLALTGGMVFWTMTEVNKLENMKTQQTAAANLQSQVTSLEGEIDAANAAVAPLQQRHDYMVSLRDFSDGYAERFRNLSRYIYQRVEVLSAQITEQGFNLTVRTKTTQDVARMWMNLRQGELDGLIAANSIQVGGLTGWPNSTSPRGWTAEGRRRFDLPLEVDTLSPVNSGSTNISSGQQGGGFGGVPGPGGGSSGSAGLAPPGPGGLGGSGAGPGLPGGEGGVPGAAGGGGGFGNTVMDFRQTSKEAMQMWLDPRSAAMLEYITPSEEPPDQPYLNMSISGAWAQPMTAPAGTGGQQGGFGGGFGGMDPFGGGMMPGLPPGAPMGPGLAGSGGGPTPAAAGSGAGP